MDLKRIKALFVDLKIYLQNYGGDSIKASYRILNNTIAMLESEQEDNLKKQIILRNYKALFFPKSELSEFYVWNDDFNTRKKLNEDFEKIHNELWNLLKEFL